MLCGLRTRCGTGPTGQAPSIKVAKFYHSARRHGNHAAGPMSRPAEMMDVDFCSRAALHRLAPHLSAGSSVYVVNDASTQFVFREPRSANRELGTNYCNNVLSAVTSAAIPVCKAGSMSGANRDEWSPGSFLPVAFASAKFFGSATPRSKYTDGTPAFTK